MAVNALTTKNLIIVPQKWPKCIKSLPVGDQLPDYICKINSTPNSSVNRDIILSTVLHVIFSSVGTLRMRIGSLMSNNVNLVGNLVAGFKVAAAKDHPN